MLVFGTVDKSAGPKKGAHVTATVSACQTSGYLRRNGALSGFLATRSTERPRIQHI